VRKETCSIDARKLYRRHITATHIKKHNGQRILMAVTKSRTVSHCESLSPRCTSDNLEIDRSSWPV